MAKNRNRSAGNGYERDIVNELKALGFFTVTSRNESKRMDDKKVDIFSPMDTPDDEIFPYFCQTKFTSNSPNYKKILDEMPNNRPGIIIHKKSVSKTCADGKVRHYADGEYVILKKEDFYNLIRKSNYDNEIGRSEEVI